MEHAYGAHKLQKVKVFNYRKENDKSMVFIHGGAWRDPDMTYNDYDDFSKYLGENVNTFGINYRLVPDVKHPLFLNDVLDGLKYISDNYSIEQTSLAGHSVGALLILQILASEKSSFLKYQTCVFIDGIYDLPELIQEYPGYESWVSEAHSSKEALCKASDVCGELKGFEKLVAIQSTEDELLSEKQTDIFTEKINRAGYKGYQVFKGKWETHFVVIKKKEVFEIVVNALK